MWGIDMLPELIDPTVIFSQIPVYFFVGVYYSKMKRIDAAVRAVELCPTCQRKLKEETDT